MTVLIPHRDARLPLRAWSAALFAAGMEGAWSFPWVVPLARVKRSLETDELKRLARLLRQRVNENGGIVTAGPPAVAVISEEIYIYGPALTIAMGNDFFDMVEQPLICRFAPAVLGAAVVQGPPPSGLPAPPPVSFRAAALANMTWRIVSPNHCAWEIGPLHWLPNK